MLIDTHSHLDFRQFDKDREQVIKRAFDKGVEKIINVGTNFESSKASIVLAEKYENIYASVSLHPIDVDKEEFDEKAYLDLAKHSKVVAIGETGFDFYHSSDKKKPRSRTCSARSLRGRQEEVFIKLIKIACEVNKPLIIHSRNADNEVLNLLRLNLDRLPNADNEVLNLLRLNLDRLPKKRGVIHCFDREYDVAKQFLDLGFLISYTGNITYKNGPIDSILEVPLDKIMIETDCPFMSPEPFRGQRNEPSYVKYVAQKIAEIKNISFEQVAEAITQNAKTFFNV